MKKSRQRIAATDELRREREKQESESEVNSSVYNKVHSII